MPMEALVLILADRLHAPVINRTGLEGEYQMTLDLPIPGGDFDQRDGYGTAAGVAAGRGLGVFDGRATGAETGATEDAYRDVGGGQGKPSSDGELRRVGG